MLLGNLLSIYILRGRCNFEVLGPGIRRDKNAKNENQLEIYHALISSFEDFTLGRLLPYNNGMRLSGLTLQTQYFEDYLSFMTEVLELDLKELTDISMKLDLMNTALEIKMVPDASHLVASNIEFTLDEDEYQAMVNKVSFFYYRRGPSRFLLLNSNQSSCELVDPDGRVWRFFNDSPSAVLNSSAVQL